MIEIEPWQPGQDLGEWADRLFEAVAELRQFAIEHVAPPLGRQGNALFLSLLERSIRWGKTTSDYVDGSNVVYLYPCDNSDGDNTDTATTITAYVVSPTDATPAGVTIPSAKVLAYVPFGDNLGMLWPVKQAGLPSNAHKSKYMVLGLTDDNGTDNDDPSLNDWDWVRAHA